MRNLKFNIIDYDFGSIDKNAPTSGEQAPDDQLRVLNSEGELLPVKPRNTARATKGNQHVSRPVLHGLFSQ